MPRIESETFYINAMKKHGVSPQGVCWLDLAHQQLRFDAICSLLPQELHSFSLSDAGCGFGDFYLYLLKNNNLPKNYIGLDSVQKMCEIAAQRTEAKIIHTDILHSELPVSDYYICSGALNVLTLFETTMFLQKCFKASKVGVIFNVLYADKESEVYNYLTKEKIEKIATELNVSSLSYIEGYLEKDITIRFLR